MARGDHVFVHRFGGLYSHHGIDCGGDAIIHYTGGSPIQTQVRKTSLADFCAGGRLEVRDYAALERLLRARRGATRPRKRASDSTAHSTGGRGSPRRMTLARRKRSSRGRRVAWAKRASTLAPITASTSRHGARQA